MTQFTLEVSDAGLRQALTRLRGTAGSMPAMLGLIGEGIQQRTKARFSSQTGPDGERWKDISSDWKRQKKSDRILQWKHHLERQTRWEVSGNRLTVGNTMVYAAIHQFGGPISIPETTVKLRHRTTATGELLRTKLFNGKGLVFAKKGDEQSQLREFKRRAYTVHMPARPYLPVMADGQLYPAERAIIMAQVNELLANALA